MSRRIVIIAAIIVVGGIVLSFPLWRPLFFNDAVDEPFPELTTEMQAAFTENLSDEQQQAYISMRDENEDMAMQMVTAALSGNTDVDEPMPNMPEPTVLAQGSFIEIDLLHGAEGSATLYDLGDGARVLRLEDFRSTNGPALSVILSRQADPRSHEAVGEDYIDLGALKGNIGNQNYDIPADVDLTGYQSVVIYCVPFHVVFSVASLSSA